MICLDWCSAHLFNIMYVMRNSAVLAPASRAETPVRHTLPPRDVGDGSPPPTHHNNMEGSVAILEKPRGRFGRVVGREVRQSGLAAPPDRKSAKRVSVS